MKQIRYIEKEDLKQVLPADPIIIEAGGHTGRDALQMSKTWPNGTIYTFEPVPHLYQKLVANTAEHNNIHPSPLALSDKTGTQTLYISGQQCDAVSSLLAPKLFSVKRPEVEFTPVTVACTTIQDWAQTHALWRIDLLWLDLQGYELAVLKHVGPLLESVRAIHAEVSLEERFADTPLYDEVRVWLEAQGFRVALETLYRKTWGNVLFVRDKLF